MPVQSGRYSAPAAASTAEGWTLERLTPVSRLFGANGLRTGTDGRIYVAQVAGSQVSAIDVDTGRIDTISPMGGAIVAPDDLAFDEEGNLYCTEITEGRVSMLAPDGTTRVICADMPVANPITCYQGHLIAGECRMGARIMELDRNGGAPHVIVDNVPMVNAFDVGPDGKLYFPVMGTNEIWRVSLEGGQPEVVARDLGTPDSVKFHPDGYIVSTQVASGQVLKIDPHTGDKSVLADIGPGLDNVTFVGRRIFVSHITGSIHEVLEPGRARPLIEKGLQWPMGLAVNADGEIYVADGGFSYTLRSGGSLQLIGMLFSHGYPGFTRGVAAAGTGKWVVTTAIGDVVRFTPAQQKSEVLATGFDQLMGVAVGSGSAVIFAEAPTGRVLAVEGGTVTELAGGLATPTGLALGADGTVYVSEASGGRIVRLSHGKAETVVDGLRQPQGIAVQDNLLYISDIGTKEVVEYDLTRESRRAIGANLPIGAPPGVTPKPLRSFLPLCGAMTPFTGLTIGADGTVYISGDAEGSVIALHPTR